MTLCVRKSHRISAPRLLSSLRITLHSSGHWAGRKEPIDLLQCATLVRIKTKTGKDEVKQAVQTIIMHEKFQEHYLANMKSTLARRRGVEHESRSKQSESNSATSRNGDQTTIRLDFLYVSSKSKIRSRGQAQQRVDESMLVRPPRPLVTRVLQRSGRNLHGSQLPDQRVSHSLV